MKTTVIQLCTLEDGAVLDSELIYSLIFHEGAIQVLCNADGGGGVTFSGKKHYGGVRFNVISVTRGWVGVQFPGKKRYVTLE